jgi:small multidrug resistance pump
MGVMYLILGVVSNAAASILIKVGSSPPFGIFFDGFKFDFVKGWPFLLGICLYVIALGFYTVALTKMPLNIVHPVMTAGSIILVLSFSVTALKEPSSVSLLVGVSLIIAGVFMVARSYVETGR